MRIDPLLIDTVAFLCEQRQARPNGTAFFVEFEDTPGGPVWHYLVTALHCIEESAGREIYVRLNTLPGAPSPLGFEDIATLKDDWFTHDKADVAILPSPIDRTRYAVQQVPVGLFVDRQWRWQVASLAGRGNPLLEPTLKANFKDGMEVQVGDEIFSPGLFVQSAGKNRNLPVVRFGNIARMPGSEEIILSTKRQSRPPVRAYLVETHSWGGFSGAPVFWHYEYNLVAPIMVQRALAPSSPLEMPKRPRPPEQMTVMVSRGWVNALLGFVSGHYDIPTSAQGDDDIETALNSGIAVVTPAENIMELLKRDDVVKDRKDRATTITEPTATADFSGAKRRTQRTLAKQEKDRIDIPIPSRSQIMTAFDKITRRKKPS